MSKLHFYYIFFTVYEIKFQRVMSSKKNAILVLYFQGDLKILLTVIHCTDRSEASVQ